MTKAPTLQRRRSLGLVLLLTLGAAAWVAANDEAQDDTVAPVPRPAAAVVPAGRAAGQAATGQAPAAWPSPPAARASAPGIVAPAAWGEPAPPPPPQVAVAAPARAPAPPAAPPAPRFPYTWIGRVDDGQQPQALLEGPTRTLSVKVRDVIDGQWRVEAVDAQGVRLVWLPTGQAVQVSKPLS